MVVEDIREGVLVSVDLQLFEFNFLILKVNKPEISPNMPNLVSNMSLLGLLGITSLS